MRVLVCGSRHFKDWYLMRDTLLQFFKGAGDVLIHGMAKGADQLSEQVLTHQFNNLGNVISIERYPADWDKYGKGAGPIRNKQMLVEGHPDLVVAFLAPHSRGTKNMIEQAEKAGVPVKVVNIG